MSESAALLRMLEPATRPTPTQSAPSRAVQPTAFEDADFDALLAEARADGEVSSASQGDAARAPDPLTGLSGLGSIENGGLRELIAAARGHAANEQ